MQVPRLVSAPSALCDAGAPHKATGALPMAAGRLMEFLPGVSQTKQPDCATTVFNSPHPYIPSWAPYCTGQCKLFRHVTQLALTRPPSVGAPGFGNQPALAHSRITLQYVKSLHRSHRGLGGSTMLHIATLMRHCPWLSGQVGR